MGILTWLGLAPLEARSTSTTVTDPLPGTTVAPPSRLLFDVTLDRALTLPTVYRSVSILATAVAQLGLDGWRADQRTARPAAIIRRPNVYRSRSAFLKRTVIGLAGCGNAYWRIDRDPAGAPLNLEVLNPLAITWRTDPRTGARTWRYTDELGRTHHYADTAIKHLRLLEVPGHVLGLGPIQAARQALGGALDLRAYADGWFGPNTIPTGVLKTDQRLTGPEADAYRTRWHDSMAAGRDVAVMGAGLDYRPIILSPKDAQFLESQQFSVTDIARLFGVPASYVLAAVEGSSMTYANLEQADTQFARYTLAQYTTEIEDALTDLAPAGQSARFDFGAFLRPDAAGRAAILTSYLTAGVLTRDEVRAAEGYGPLPTTPTAQEVPANV